MNQQPQQPGMPGGEFGPSGFDHEQVPDSVVVPKGDYVGMIVKAELKTNKAGNGKYLSVDFQVTEGPLINSHVFDNWTTVHPNPQAVRIGTGTLSSLCKAIGVRPLMNCSQLLGQRVIAKVAVKDGDQGPENRLTGFKPAGAAQMPGATAQPLPADHQQQQAAAAAGQPPAPVQYPQQPMQQPVQQPAQQPAAAPQQAPAPQEAPQQQQLPGSQPPPEGRPW